MTRLPLPTNVLRGSHDQSPSQFGSPWWDHKGQQVGKKIYQIRNDVFMPLLKISLILLLQYKTDRELLRA